MDYTRTTEEKVKREVEEAMKSGVPIVGLDLFDSVDNLKINDTNKNGAMYTIDLYREYLQDLKTLPEKLYNQFLKTLKHADVLDNQLVENENSFLIALYRSSHTKSAIDSLIATYGEEMSKEDFVKYHDFLLKGTSSEDKTGLRTNNYKFVGSLDNGIRKIQYFPILEENIDAAITKFLNYYNSNIGNIQEDYDAIIRPIIYHGLIATLQLFNDGNTRYSRLIQHINIWGLMNQLDNEKTELPIVYATRQYFAVRDDYRKLIMNIAMNKEDAWNDWIRLNLRSIQNNIYLNEGNINTLRRKM